jgi:hypothetical protein
MENCRVPTMKELAILEVDASRYEAACSEELRQMRMWTHDDRHWAPTLGRNGHVPQKR